MNTNKHETTSIRCGARKNCTINGEQRDKERDRGGEQRHNQTGSSIELLLNYKHIKIYRGTSFFTYGRCQKQTEGGKCP